MSLKAGSENKKIILHLISITSIRSDSLISMLLEFYTVGGVPIYLCEKHGITMSNFRRGVRVLDKLVDDIEVLQKMRLGLL